MIEYTRKPIVYIAGPFRADHDWGRHCHVHAAETAALHVWRMGGVALCPHNNTRHFDGVLPHQVWLEGDLALLRVSHAVLMIWGWDQSSGARAEREAAQEWDLPIFYVEPATSYDMLQAWIVAWRENHNG